MLGVYCRSTERAYFDVESVRHGGLCTMVSTPWGIMCMRGKGVMFVRSSGWKHLVSEREAWQVRMSFLIGF